MSVHLFDTYSRELREFKPIDPSKVGLYCCGPTVYDYAHIGNLRTYLFEDILRRVLEFNDFALHHVVNITDVGHLTSDADSGEDKMEAGSRRTGMTAWDIAEKYTVAFKHDLQRLNVLEPHVWCRATDHIDEQIAAIQLIEKRGATYQTDDGIYFDTSTTSDYGYLARLDVAGLKSGIRVDAGEKRNATDFALWKFSPPQEHRQMEWDSPWGRGFPGWHIECSAMSAKYLGPLFDIHCGGKDHIPIHHTNEIAQSQACFDTQLANYWLHGYFLELDQGKMAKSTGEFLRLDTLIERGYDPLAYRYLCLTAHYRTDLKFAWNADNNDGASESLDSASVALNRLRRGVYGLTKATDSDAASEPAVPDQQSQQRFLEFINDDLNTPRAMALAWDVLKGPLPDGVKSATVLEFDRVFGLDLATWQPAIDVVPEAIAELARERELARQNKDWQRADEIRNEVSALGFDIEDSTSGSIVRPKE